MSKYTSSTTYSSKSYTPSTGTSYTPTVGATGTPKATTTINTTLNATTASPKVSTTYTPGSYGSPSTSGSVTQGYKPQTATPTQPTTTSYQPSGTQSVTRPQSTYTPTATTGVSSTPTNGKTVSQVGGYAPQQSSIGQVKPIQGFSQVTQSKPTEEVKAPADDLKTKAQLGKSVLKSTLNKTTSTSAYDTLMNSLKATGEIFRDLEFAPSLKSLAGEDRKMQQKWSAAVWRTPDEFWGSGYEIFQGGIEPNDIKQGALGDCYFLSSLSALAEFPKRIEKLFRDTKVNGQKCYMVQICEMGEWKEIIVDDLFPCKDKNSGPIFTKGNDQELWVLLLEKAWAKIYKSYSKIEAGLPKEVLHDLTGGPTETFYTDSADDNELQKIWEALESGDQKNYVMCAGSGDLSGDGDDVLTSSGLVGSHAYSLISALTIKTNKGPKRLLRLRNPWGGSEWTGDWSDDSSLWTPEIKKQVESQVGAMEKKDDGIFFMSFEDFCKYFTDVQVCRVHDDYQYSSLRFPVHPKHAVYVRFQVQQEGHYYITINQKAKRHFHEQYEYSNVSVVFGRELSQGEYEYIEGIQKADREVWTDGRLKPGTYVAYVKIPWRDGQAHDATISAYGHGNVSFEVLQKTVAGKFLEKVYSNKALNSDKLKSYEKDGEPNVFKCFENTDDGFGYFFFSNKGESTLQAEIFFKQLTGIRLRKPYSGKSFKVSVAPGQQGIVITKIDSSAKVAQAYSEAPTFQRSEGQLRNLAKEKGQKKQKKHPKTQQEVDICCHVLQHSDGVFFLYENNTKDLTLEEEVKFKLQGLKIEEQPTDTVVKFVLAPGQVKEIKLKKTQNEFSIGYSSGYALK